MKLQSRSVTQGQPIPEHHAFAVPDPERRIRLGANVSPHIEWSGLPDGVRGLALICHDQDVPAETDEVNRPAREITADAPRVDFFHWVLVDVDPALAQLPEGAFSNGVTPTGKRAIEGPFGTRQGLNDYTGFLADHPELGGRYFGYDGPAPPWNDTAVHHYHFTLYALTLDRCPVDGEFTGQEVLRAIEDHVIQSTSLMGTYTLNPRVRI